MGLANVYKNELQTLELSVLNALKDAIGKRKLELTRPIIVVEHGEENEVLTAINEDLMVDTELVHETAEECANIADYPIHIQIALLEEIENNKFVIEVREDEE
jgi:hypothetical protein